MQGDTTAGTAPSAAQTAAANIAALQAKLSEYDFYVVLDGSGSMAEPDKNGKNRWESMEESATAFAREIQKIDSDGIGVAIFSGGSIDAIDGVTADKVKEIFSTRRPSGGTPMAQALDQVLNMAKKSNKKKFITIFTDGLPDNEETVANLIIKQANSQATDEECTFFFVQVGNDPKASAYLRRLDDNLKGAKFDIVDAKTIDEVDKFPSIVELVQHAIND